MLNAIRNIALLALGLFQLAAITLGLEAWLGYHWSIMLFIAIFLTPLPAIGTAAAILGATYAWHWPLLKACLAFGLPLLFIFGLTLTIRGIEKATGKRQETA